MNKYYYVDANKQKAGPISPNEFQNLGITDTTLVWTKGMTQWTRAGQVSELVDVFATPEEQEEPVPAEKSEPEEEEVQKSEEEKEEFEEKKFEEEEEKVGKEAEPEEEEAEPEEEEEESEEEETIISTKCSKLSPVHHQQKSKVILGISAAVIILALVLGVLIYAFCDKNGELESTGTGNVTTQTTPDLSMQYLRGPVKTITVLRKNLGDKEWVEVAKYEFDEQGRLTSHPGWPEDYIISYENSENGMVTNEGGYEVERDKLGRITSLQAEQGFGAPFGIYWNYDEDVVTESLPGYDNNKRVLAKNDEGLPITMEGTFIGRGTDESWDRQYEYNEFDDQGNYTKAFYTEVLKEKNAYTGKVKTHSTEWEEKRVITYY